MPLQLGNGAFAASPVPVAVAGGHAFVQIATGCGGVCGLSQLGVISCWGGAAEFSAVSTPVEVVSGVTFASITLGYYHGCALTSSGAAWCFG